MSVEVMSVDNRAVDASLPPYRRVIESGEILTFSTFPGKDETYAMAREALLEAARLCAGPEAAASIAREGLDQFHKFVSPDLVPFVDRYLTKSAVKKRFLELVADFGRSTLDINDEFYVDDTVVFRVHFPYEVGKHSKLQRAVYRAVNLNNIADAENEVAKAYAEFRDKPLQPADEATARYHGNLPVPAWVHGPHKDTWFGHTFEAMNLWWSLSAVTEKTGVIFYPDLFGIDSPHLPKPAYIAPGTPLPKPMKTAMGDGDMLVFNSDHLHGTHLNISDTTRIVFTGRINPKKPTFYRDTMEAEYPHWHLASDLLSGHPDDIKEFRRRDNYGRPAKASYKRRITSHKQIVINRRLANEAAVPVCNVDDLNIGEKCLVRFEDVQVILARTDKSWRAVSAICPHVGINLIDGYNDDEVIYCPGHGVAFDLKTGQSECASLMLRSFTVSVDAAGQVVLATDRR